MTIMIANHTPPMADVLSGSVQQPQSLGKWCASHPDIACARENWFTESPAGRELGADVPLLVVNTQDALNLSGAESLHEAFLADLKYLVFHGSNIYAVNADGTRSGRITDIPRVIAQNMLLHFFTGEAAE